MDDDDFGIFITPFLVILQGAFVRKRRRTHRNELQLINRTIYEESMSNQERDKENFFGYTRMTPRLFGYLLSLVGSKLHTNATRTFLPPAHCLIITLHYLAYGCSMGELSWGEYDGHNTVCMVIRETIQVLLDVLSPNYMNMLSEDEFKATSKGFLKKMNVPNCIGAVDCKHIIMEDTHYSGSVFYNYETNHISVVLMASCDAFFRFTMVDIGIIGKVHESVYFDQFTFGQSILQGKIKIPEPSLLPNTDLLLPHFFVANSTFPQNPHVIRPYPEPNLSPHKKFFNYRLSRATRTIENAFGILAQRWRILNKPIVANVSTVEDIVNVVVALHNFLQSGEQGILEEDKKYCPTGYVDVELEDGTIRPGAWRSGLICKVLVN